MLPHTEASVQPMVCRFQLSVGATAPKTWWPIYTPHSGHFVVAGDQGDLIHIEEHLPKPTQMHIDQIFRFSTSFVSVSARLALE